MAKAEEQKLYDIENQAGIVDQPTTGKKSKGKKKSKCKKCKKSGKKGKKSGRKAIQMSASTFLRMVNKYKK
jgi:hypothetical protein